MAAQSEAHIGENVMKKGCAKSALAALWKFFLILDFKIKLESQQEGVSRSIQIMMIAC